MILTPILKDFLVGTLLGDSSLVASTKKPVTRWYYSVEHSEQQKSYLYRKYDLLKDFTSSPPYELEKKKPAKNGKKLIHYAFKTPLHETFQEYGKAFYKYQPSTDSYVKRVPVDLRSRINPRALAYWYMDDGSQKGDKHKMVYLNTQGFGEKGSQELAMVIYDVFQLKTAVVTKLDKRNNKYYSQVSIHGSSLENLRSLIEPFMLPDLKALPAPAKKRGRKPKVIK